MGWTVGRSNSVWGGISVLVHTSPAANPASYEIDIVRLKDDGTRAETRFRLSPKRTSPLKLVGASVQSTAGNRGVRISVSNAGYIMFRGSVKSTGYPLHSPVSPSRPHPCLTVCHQISNALYRSFPGIKRPGRSFNHPPYLALKLKKE
jgi:hypothetical protein